LKSLKRGGNGLRSGVFRQERCDMLYWYQYVKGEL